MKNTKRDKRTELEKEIDDVIRIIRHEVPGSDQYREAVEMLERLTDLKEKPREKASWNTIWTVCGSLAGIALVIGHEQLGNVISTKAIGFVLRGRV